MPTIRRRAPLSVFLSYSNNNATHADAIADRLASERDIVVDRGVIDSPPYGAISSFTEAARTHTCCIQLVSVSFLRSKNCMREVVYFMKDDNQRDHYLRRTIPVVVPPSGDEPPIDIFRYPGQLEVLDFWIAERASLEAELNQRASAFPEAAAALQTMSHDLVLLRDIAENVLRFLRAVSDDLAVPNFSALEKRDFAPLISRIREHKGAMAHPRHSSNAAEFASYLEQIVGAVVVPSKDDPQEPEFPPGNPRFPATRTDPLHIPVLDRTVYIKDESWNNTGSHKDRMAWEIAVYYQNLAKDMLSAGGSTNLPAMSIISNGSAALAIQVMLNRFNLPHLRVLMDIHTDDRVIAMLEGVGCEVVTWDLQKAELDSDEVLRLTSNRGGLDLTSRNLVDPNRTTYYDWLSYEILNERPRHLFVPVGTGDLYVNIVTVLRDEVRKVRSDPRRKVPVTALEELNIYGATSRNPRTRLDKLYAKFRPTLDEAQQVLAEMREGGVVAPASRIADVSESHVDQALELAQGAGINCEPSGIAGLALFLELSDSIPVDEKVVIVNTGWMHVPT